MAKGEPPLRQKVKFALQGGGAHGAFTWGVLDRLLEDGRIEVEALCGTPAGAVNATLLAHGLALGGSGEARAALRRFWLEIGRLASLLPLQPSPLDLMLSPGDMTYSPAWKLADLMTGQVSPYDLNPSNLDPLRDLIDSMADFARLRAGGGPPLFVCATNGLTGRLRMFEKHEMTADCVMASACLPMLFQAVEVGGEYLWDGGYSGNPPIFPLISLGGGPDILIIPLNPINIPEVPRAIADIIDRVNTLSFNASLMREMRMIRLVTDLIDRGELSRGRFLRLSIHTIG
ncbi:MAG: patatin-like phospholipase family protein, partial [Elioraea sp.]|nr:patatin-like phospholipase family protein [Elioraea sp.]